ncbi:MAG: iron-containing alcohol dehydrogenase [Deltaproteobacteria bacterium]
MDHFFSFTGAKKIVFGNGCFNSLPTQIAEMRAVNPLILVDGALAKLGMEAKVADLFKGSSMKCNIFADISPEPTVEIVDKIATIAKKAKSDIVIGIGGGSAMDVAKAVAVLATNNGKATDYVGLNKVPKAGLPTIMVPTTAGTGSEVTFTAVFIRKDIGKKQGINSPFLYPSLALLDPCLTVSVPPMVSATTGIDALCHAIESYTSIIASPMSELVSAEAIMLIGDNLRDCVHNGGNIEARSNMLLGSLYAGLGLANAGVTAVHSLSYPLGGRYGVPHGLANTLLLPAVMEYNIPSSLNKFANIAELLGENIDGLSLRDAADLAVDAVMCLIADCGINVTLKDVGVKKTDLAKLAKEAMEVARPLANNPRAITAKDMIEIYNIAF